MDRRVSRGRRVGRRIVTGGALALVGLLAGVPTARCVHAEWRAPSPSSGTTDGAVRTSWSEALLRTKTEGIPTILVVTSRAVPASALTARALVSKEANQRLRGAVQLAELCVEDEPEQAKNLMVTRFPTIVALKLGTGSKFVVAGSRNGVMSLEELTGWIEGLGLVESPSESTTTDPQLVKTSLFTASTTAPPAASPQYPTPPAPVKMIPVMPPQPAPPPPPPPPVEREVYVEQPAEREVIIEREVAPEPAPTREVIREVVVEAEPEPAPREVVREVVVERAPAPAPREVVREVVVQRGSTPSQPRSVTSTPRNVLTRSAPTRERQVVVQRSAAPTRTVTTRAAAPAPTQVVREIIREVAAPAPAPTQVVREVVREVAPAPTQVVREVVREAAPTTTQVVREVSPVSTRGVSLGGNQPVNLIRPGILGRAVGGLGNRLRVASLPRIEVAEQTQTEYVPVAPRDRGVYLSDTAGPQLYAVEAEAYYPEERRRRHVCGSHCPHDHAPAPAPAPAPVPQPYYVPVPTPVYTPPYAPSPQSR